MTDRLDFFVKFVCYFSLLIDLPNGSRNIAQFPGTVRLWPKFAIHHVLYVPNLKRNLISNPNCCILIICMEFIFLRICVVQDHNLRKEISIVRLVSGVYNFSQEEGNRVSSISLQQANHTTKVSLDLFINAWVIFLFLC